MSHPLDGCRAKLDRAREHLEALMDEISAEDARVREAGGVPPISIAGTEETDLTGTWTVIRCTAIDLPPPMHWGLVAGDAMHNVRTALDHLACRLVELAGNTPSNQTAFPVRRTQPRTPRQREGFQALIRGMSRKHQQDIRLLQPFQDPHSPHSVKLITLAALDNLDKHNLILPTIATLAHRAGGKLAFLSPKPGRVEIKWNTGCVVVPGVEIARYRPLGEHQVVHAGIPLIFAPSFGPGCGVAQLEEIRAHVVGIIESFAPEF